MAINFEIGGNSVDSKCKLSSIKLWTNRDGESMVGRVPKKQCGRAAKSMGKMATVG